MISNFKICRPQQLLFSTVAATLHHLDHHNHFRTETSANEYLHWLCNSKLYREAAEVFHFLQSQRPNFPLSPTTYRHLFHAASQLGSTALCRQIHRHLSLSGTQPDIILQNHILTAFGKCGSLEDAKKVFDKMPDWNVASWTAMITGYVSNSREEEAVGLYMEMRQLGLCPSEFTLGSVTGACSHLGDLELGKQLHGHVLKLDRGSERLVQNALVNMYGKSGRVDDASLVFARIMEKDVVSWGAMMSGLAQNGDGFEALCCFQQMQRMGDQRPNEILFESVFRACGVLLCLECGEQMHGLCLKVGVGRSAFAGCSLIDMYAKCGLLEYSRKTFHEIEMPDLVAWNSIISSFAQGGNPDESLLLFLKMRRSDVEPDNITVRHLLCGFRSRALLCEGQQVHSYIFKMGYTDVAVSNTLLTMYSKCSDYSTACHLFEEMKNNRDLVTLNAFLRACLQHNQPNKVFQLLKLIHDSGTKPDSITLNIMLCACAELSCLETACQVHAYSSKVGLESELLVTNGLLNAYAKCGNLEDAKKMFKLSGDALDVVSWSSLISGYAQFGLGKEALALFHEMQILHVKPNQVIFVGVLSACSRVGMVDEGCYHFEAMQREYGIAPTRQHFSCMIDMLARAGMLIEAKRLIDQIPFEPDVVVWKTLLNACRIHSNVEIGERVAEAILKIDPLNSTAYALLCNIYASAGNWNAVARLRNIMRSNGLMKSSGKSWINVNGKVHYFVLEDRSHPETEEIYTLLETLGVEMDEDEYVLV